MEAIERQKKEEQERLERKKRVEEIMARTRKARAAAGKKDAMDGDGQTQGADDVADSNESSANVSPVRELNEVSAGNQAESPAETSPDVAAAPNAVTATPAPNGLMNGWVICRGQQR